MNPSDFIWLNSIQTKKTYFERIWISLNCLHNTKITFDNKKYSIYIEGILYKEVSMDTFEHMVNMASEWIFILELHDSILVEWFWNG